MQCEENECSSVQIDAPESTRTKVMNMAQLMAQRNSEFRQTLGEIVSWKETAPSDKKEEIDRMILETHEKYFDCVKDLYHLSPMDNRVAPGKSTDKVLYRREVLEPLRIKDEQGNLLHIYQNSMGEYEFIDEDFKNNDGITFDDIHFFVLHHKQFRNEYHLPYWPVGVSFYGKTVLMPNNVTSFNPVEDDLFWDYLNKILLFIGTYLSKNKKLKVTSF